MKRGLTSAAPASTHRFGHADPKALEGHQSDIADATPATYSPFCFFVMKAGTAANRLMNPRIKNSP